MNKDKIMTNVTISLLSLSLVAYGIFGLFLFDKGYIEEIGSVAGMIMIIVGSLALISITFGGEELE